MTVSSTIRCDPGTAIYNTAIKLLLDRPNRYPCTRLFPQKRIDVSTLNMDLALTVIPGDRHFRPAERTKRAGVRLF